MDKMGDKEPPLTDQRCQICGVLRPPLMSNQNGYICRKCGLEGNGLDEIVADGTDFVICDEQMARDFDAYLADRRGCSVEKVETFVSRMRGAMAFEGSEAESIRQTLQVAIAAKSELSSDEWLLFCHHPIVALSDELFEEMCEVAKSRGWIK